MISVIFRTFLISLCLVAQASAALSARDKMMPLDVKSDAAYANLKQGTMLYSGEVRVVHDQKKLEADSLILNTQAGHIQNFEAQGHPAKTQDVTSQGGSIAYGEANVIDYYPDQQLVVYKKQAVFKQDGKVFQGNEISYDNRTQIVSSLETASEKSHTKIILPPYSSSFAREGHS